MDCTSRVEVIDMSRYVPFVEEDNSVVGNQRVDQRVANTDCDKH